MMEKMSDRIRRLRERDNITQRELADVIGVTVGAVGQWEQGRTLPKIRFLPEIAETFSMSVDELLFNLRWE